MPSFAGLFELAHRASAGDLDDKVLITLEHAQQAAQLCVYLESHAMRVYSCAVSPERRAARELARHVQNGDLGCRFTTREVYFKGWSGLGDPDCARSALQLLEDAEWIRREAVVPSPAGGRPSEVWAVNPKVMQDAK